MREKQTAGKYQRKGASVKLDGPKCVAGRPADGGGLAN